MAAAFVAPATIAGKIEVRGVGIVDMPYVAEVPAALAVRLDADVRNCWMIGDSTMDLATARNSGARAVAVAWGYHPPDVLAAHGPDFMAATPEHLLSMTRQTLAAS